MCLANPEGSFFKGMTSRVWEHSPGLCPLTFSEDKEEKSQFQSKGFIIYGKLQS